MSEAGFVVHALLGVDPAGKTDEASREFDSLTEALAGVAEIAAAVPGFRAVTIVHREDWPALMGGSASLSAVSDD
jgi:hypothetical protein